MARSPMEERSLPLYFGSRRDREVDFRPRSWGDVKSQWSVMVIGGADGRDRTVRGTPRPRLRTSVAPGATLAGLAPPLAEVPLPAPNAAALLRRNGMDPRYVDRPALRFGDRQWTHRELLAESERFAALYRARLDPGRPLTSVSCWTTPPTTSLRSAVRAWPVPPWQG